MPIEVEQKFRVTDLSAVERRLAELGAKHRQTVDQVDCYFAHPARDFAKTDEALRVRRVGDMNYITYKGPKLDATTKTRREIEIELAQGMQAAGDAAALFEALGFKPVGEVHKRRAYSTLSWQDRDVEVALDEVASLGPFVELEIMAGEHDVAQARDRIASLATRLGLSSGERRSYLELLLAQLSQQSRPE